MTKNDSSVLLIYTGGTIGMRENPETGNLEAFNFLHLIDNVPELKRLGSRISTLQFDPPIDSSDMNPARWRDLVNIITDNYHEYDGFVVLHGTDTMAFTASALSFMLEDLNKPVILTGSQLPIGVLRTDGKENLITAIEIASAKNDNGPIVPEVCILFDNLLLRGNRTIKTTAENFNAFNSYNYPPLAKIGIHIKYDTHVIKYSNTKKKLKPHYLMDTNLAVLKIFPGISKPIIDSIINTRNLKGIILESYGSGNAMTQKWFLDSLKKGIDKGLVIVNISQCIGGSVQMDLYESGSKLKSIGVLSGYDMTTEAALAKLMFLFGHNVTNDVIKKYFNIDLCGEMTIHDYISK